MPFRPNQPYHIVCEGLADRVFWHKLIASRDVNGFEALPAGGIVQTGGGGLDEYGRHLKALKGLLPGSGIRKILVTADCREDSRRTFARIKEYLEGEHYPSPSEPLQIRDGTINDHPIRLAVLLVPWPGKKGGLETLLIQHLEKNKAEIFSCIDQYRECTRAYNRDWETEKLDKMRMNCFVSATNRGNPTASIHIYLSQSNAPIDFRDTIFDEIAKYLKAFGENA